MTRLADRPGCHGAEPKAEDNKRMPAEKTHEEWQKGETKLERLVLLHRPAV